MKAYELIEKPENWTKGELARNTDAQACDVESPNAFCFCMMGAIDKIYGPSASLNGPVRKKVVDELEKTTNGSLADFNDTHTHQEVYELLKRLDI